jgi:hypothetical protein
VKLRSAPLDDIHQELLATLDERPRKGNRLVRFLANASYRLEGRWRRAAIRWLCREDRTRRQYPERHAAPHPPRNGQLPPIEDAPFDPCGGPGADWGGTMSTPTIDELLAGLKASTARWAELREVPETAEWAQSLSARVASMEAELARQLGRDACQTA